MKVLYPLTLGLILSIMVPAVAQPPAGQQQQQDHKQAQQKNRDHDRSRSRQQARPQNQQQARPRNQQQAQPRTRQQPRQMERQRPQRSTRNLGRERYVPRYAPPRQNARTFRQSYYREPNGRIDRRPLYRNGVWYGRAAPNDARFRLRRPYAHGRFYRYGPRYYHRIIRFNRANYWFWLASGYYFQIAYWDWPYAAGWCWTCGDEFQIYLDPDHPGWYLVLNLQTGVYVHAIFMGA